MQFFKNIVFGIALGAGAILPGISSGVLCVIFGIYETLLNSILYFFRDIKKNLLFLFPLGLGGFLGIFLLGNILSYLFTRFEIPMKCIFLGLILGSIPSLFKEACPKKKFRLHYLLYTLTSFLFTFALFSLENQLPFSNSETASPTFQFLFLCGFLMSAGIIIPGVSNTAILMCLGIYSTYLHAIASLNLSILLPMVIGIILGSFIFMLLIQYLLKNYHIPTFFSIIGFVLGSTILLFPNFSFDSTHIIGYIGFFISFFLIIKCVNKRRRPLTIFFA